MRGALAARPLEVAWTIKASADASGNTLGYATASTELLAALRRLGMRETSDARAAVHFMFPANYEPVSGRVNVLFTMFESFDLEVLTGIFAPAFSRCDVIVTPSRFCADIFARFTNKPIHVCPLGVDLENFPYKRRRWRPWRQEAFRWLYVGAPNPRKWTILPTLADHILREEGERGRVELYIKTTGPTESRAMGRILGTGHALPQVEHHPEGAVYRQGWVTVDTRRLPRARLAPEVYHRAHGKLFPHMGEGWGLTALESMATGLPLVVSDWSGTQEFCSAETAFLVDVEEREMKLSRADGLLDSPDSYRGAWPNETSAADRIAEVMANYHRATVVASRAAEVARRFTWDAAARRLLAILRPLI